MDNMELNLNKERTTGGGDGFVDRSKVRILLCDNDAKSSEEVCSLLLKCSYQVTSVKSARQVIDALNAEGPDIDIILSEVDLPMAKGFKLLKYISRDKELRRIPVIMMSAQDEVSVVVKCLRLGAADFLVKPLRTNELLNLWTHMWRRRRVLGLGEKNILNYDFDLPVSDPSDATTNSTTLLSDETDERNRRGANPEVGGSSHADDEPATSAAAAVVVAAADAAAAVTENEPYYNGISENRPDVPGISDRKTAQFTSGPKKSELKIGESSAFFTYVKSSTLKINYQDDSSIEHLNINDKAHLCGQQEANVTRAHENGEAWEHDCSPVEDFPSSSSIPDSLSLERSCTPPFSTEYPEEKNLMEDKSSHVRMSLNNEPQHDVQGLPPQQAAYPYYMPRAVNQVMMTSSTQLFQENLQNHGIFSPFNHHMPQCIPGGLNGMPSFPYYPVNMCMQPGQMPAGQCRPSFGSSVSSDVKVTKADRREAALIKFRQKRKERCFDKKIRYVNRKKLAERRPRVRGQFVRKVNGITVDLNGQPTSASYDEDEGDEEDQVSRDSSPEDDTSAC